VEFRGWQGGSPVVVFASGANHAVTETPAGDSSRGGFSSSASVTRLRNALAMPAWVVAGRPGCLTAFDGRDHAARNGQSALEQNRVLHYSQRRLAARFRATASRSCLDGRVVALLVVDQIDETVMFIADFVDRRCEQSAPPIRNCFWRHRTESWTRPTRSASSRALLGGKS
jgi:hypothetical protein